MRHTFRAGGILASLLVVASADQLPYNPSRILLAANSTIAYIFEPSSQDSTQSRLLSLELSNTLTTNTTFDTLCDTLPFLQADTLVPYTPILESGYIVAITGNCSAGAAGVDLWVFEEPEYGTGLALNSSWKQHQTSAQQAEDDTTAAGANFLAGGIAFSADGDGDFLDTSFFLFGGMCPFENSTADTWTSAANYSSSMLAMAPQGEDADTNDYEVELASSSSAPIAEAGFSTTPLIASYTVNSTGGVESQQQSFVLLGGHTESAFINMSQVALYSLPQESWTFLPVQQPTTAKTDLTARGTSSTAVEPRSGHTAVLTEDGSSIVLFGGWVGAVTNPATPQLAILQLGSSYGGSGDWTWTIPSTTGQGLSSGAGIFGHGAAMLPGGVMMVVGGYEIPATSSKRVKRDTLQASSTIMFFNVTSNTWIDTYDPPKATTKQSQNQSSGLLSKTAQKAGLGVGLALGFLILVGLIIFYFWYTRRLKRIRNARGQALLSSDDGSVGRISQPFLQVGDEQGTPLPNYYQQNDRPVSDQYPWAPQMQQNGSATGLFVDIPSPTRGLRRGVGSKSYQYQAAPRFDEKRLSRGSGMIHSIAEHEDEDALGGREKIHDDMILSEAQMQLKEVERILSSSSLRELNDKHASSDPFGDPVPNPLGSHPVSPEPSETLRRVVTGPSHLSTSPRRWQVLEHDGTPNWTVEYPDSEDQAGRISPTKSDERTSSTLSEMSQRSINSGHSITRTMSTRTGALLAAAAAVATTRHTAHSPDPSTSTEERTSTMSTNGGGGRKSPFHFSGRARSSTSGSITGVPVRASGDNDSFSTAKSNFALLQSEGEALLGGRPAIDRDDPYQRALAAHDAITSRRSTSHEDPSSSYTLPSVAPRRGQGLLGSLRRALGAISTGERSFSLTASSQERYNNEQGRSSSSSPTKDPRRSQIGGAPRRAVSDGGALLRQKRGKQDWEGGEGRPWPRYRDDDPDPGDWGEPGRTSLEAREAEEEWDVEKAAAARDVQVMFTVPKARLRVVNADMDRASVRSASDGAVSRSNSLRRDLRREESLQALKARQGVDMPAVMEGQLGEKEEVKEEKLA